MYGLGSLAGLVKDGIVPGATQTYLAACAGTAVGALTGSSPLIIAAESAVGIKEGGRTGLTAVTVAACFLVSLPLSPLLQALPAETTSPVLILVGTMMLGEASHIEWGDMTTALPAFLTMVVQPFTFSIANGIYVGLAFSLVLFILNGDFMAYLPGASSKSSALPTDSAPVPELDQPLLTEGQAPATVLLQPSDPRGPPGTLMSPSAAATQAQQRSSSVFCQYGPVPEPSSIYDRVSHNTHGSPHRQTMLSGSPVMPGMLGAGSPQFYPRVPN